MCLTLKLHSIGLILDCILEVILAVFGSECFTDFSHKKKRKSDFWKRSKSPLRYLAENFQSDRGLLMEQGTP
jgi:hypothetical protein